MGNHPGKEDENGEPPPPADAEFVEQTAIVAKPIHKNVQSIYKFKEELGSGAFSTVFKAVHKESGEIVAIKHVSKADVPSQEDIDALLEEVAILQAIHHPHVMHLLAFYDDSKYFSLVTEIVDGGELFDRIVEKQHYNEHIAREFVKIFLMTLDFLHSNGIVHRDLKPENLLLASKDNDTDMKIADFGFAKHISEPLNTVCGTPDYIAPEVCSLLDMKKIPKGERPCYNEKCDIWSAGVIVYILLGGYPPFFDESRKKLFNKIKSGVFEFHPQYWEDTSAEAKDLISKMLTVDPKKRPSAAALLNHPWIHKDEGALKGKDLTGTLEELKRFNGKRKFRAAVDAVVATQRITSMFVAHHPEAAAAHPEAHPGSFVEVEAL